MYLPANSTINSHSSQYNYNVICVVCPIQSKQADPSLLPVEDQEECIALQEELAEEHKETSELQRRRTELEDRVSSQENEMESLTKTISNLEAKVSCRSKIKCGKILHKYIRFCQQL